MNQEQALLKILAEEFTRIRTRNPAYSLRAYARRLQVPHSSLSAILNGKLRITRKTAEKICLSLGLAPEAAQALLKDLSYRVNKSPEGPLLAFEALNMDEFYLVSDWFYFAVFALAHTEGFMGRPTEIAKALGIPIRDAKTATQRLVRLGLLTRNKSRRLIPTGKNIKTSSGIPSAYIRKNHFQSLELARQAMEEDEFDACDFSSITLPADPKALPKVRQEIRAFRSRVARVLGKGKNTRVYRFNLQLFPLSHRNPKPKETRL